MYDYQHAFPAQHENEPVFIFARPYPLAFLPTTLIFLFVFFFSLVGQYVFSNNLLIPLAANEINIAIAFLSVFQLFILTVFFIAVFDFYFDILIVTNRRLVDIDQEQLFFRRISELALEDVEDASSEQKGVWQTLFNYGTVEIQTAGTRANFLVSNVYMPRELTAITLNLAEQAASEVPVAQRVPATKIMGLIDNQPVTSSEQLISLGAAPENAG